jgi:hypothetical protein
MLVILSNILSVFISDIPNISYKIVGNLAAERRVTPDVVRLISTARSADVAIMSHP